MKKGLFLLTLFVTLILATNFVSAGWFDSYQNYRTDNFKETTEFKKTTETNVKDYWGSEKIKTTYSEKTEIDRTIKTPTYNPYYRYSSRNVPYSNWRYKEPYNSQKYWDDKDYYYKPRYDSYQGYYNWRY